MSNDNDITQRIPIDWAPTRTEVVSRRLRPITMEIAFIRAATQPIKFCPIEAHEIWIAELRKVGS